MTTSAGLATARPEDLAAAGARAAIVVVCREPGAREILGRELSKRYGADYQIVVCDRPAELETRMRDLLAAGLPVAAVLRQAPGPFGSLPFRGARPADFPRHLVKGLDVRHSVRQD